MNWPFNGLAIQCADHPMNWPFNELAIQCTHHPALAIQRTNTPVDRPSNGPPNGLTTQSIAKRPDDAALDRKLPPNAVQRRLSLLSLFDEICNKLIIMTKQPKIGRSHCALDAHRSMTTAFDDCAR